MAPSGDPRGSGDASDDRDAGDVGANAVSGPKAVSGANAATGANAVAGDNVDGEEPALPIGAPGGLFAAAARRPLGGLQTAGRHLARSLRLMVGIPDYDTYVAHMRERHPDREPMSYEAFFRERQQARYGGGGGRCC